jgi:quinol monooxygenase YgiN
MSAFTVVRFKVKPGREQEFLDAHGAIRASWPGLVHANIIKTGEQTFCIIAQWTGMAAMAAARPHMIETLNSFRDTLEDLGGGLGVTDPAAGEVVAALK